MKMRVAAVATAATAIVMLSACGDDDSSTTTPESSTTNTEAPAAGATTLAKGEDVELVGDTGLGDQKLNIDAEEANGQVTGEMRITDPDDGEVVIAVDCADTDTDGVVILAGTVMEADNDTSGLVALFIKEGDPDSVAVWYDEFENPSCGNLLQNRRDLLDDDSAFVDVEDDSDIETG